MILEVDGLEADGYGELPETADGSCFGGYTCGRVVGVLYQFAVYRFPCQHPVAVSGANVGIQWLDNSP